MSEVLIVTKEKVSAPPNYTVVGINNYDGVDVNCFTPKGTVMDANYHVCFVPFSKEHGWNYKQIARGSRYHLGNDRCRIVETDFTYPVHKKIGLSYNEEVELLLLTIEYFLSENDTVTLSHKVELEGKQARYLQHLIEEEKVRVLYD